MSVKNVIKLSELEGAKRIDAEYYQPDYLKAISKILSVPTNTINQLSESVLSFGAYSLCNYIVWKESGIPYIKAENIQEGYIDFSETMFIDDDIHNILKKSQIKENQVLFSMSGTIGNAAVAYNIPNKLNSNQDIAKITLKKRYSPSYVTSFLNSKYGKLQTQRELVGSVQQHIFLWQIKNLKIPIISEEIEREIEIIYKEGLNEFEKSNSLYFQAENLLLEELKLKDFKPKHKLSYTTNLSKAFRLHRVDAEYFQPAYDEVINKIMEYSKGYTKLLNNVDNIKPDFDPKRYPNKTFSYVELADIESAIGVIHSASEIKGEETPSRARRNLRENDVIVSSVEGSLEKVALVNKEYEGSLASTGFFQFRPKKILPEVLLVLSKSIALQTQLKKECAGTILTAVPNESLSRVIIPIISNEIQQKIATLIQQSHKAREKANELLNEAKRKVEEAIEIESK